MKVESYKTQIIRTKSGSYFGELWVNNKLYQKPPILPMKPLQPYA